MKSPLPDEGSRTVPRTPEDVARERLTLARKWAYVVSKSAYVPMAHAEFEQELRGLLDELLAAVLSEPFSAERATGVGARLVALNCTGETSLRSTVDILGRGMLGLRELRHVDRLAEKVVSVLGSLSSSYATAIRRDTFDQQEHAKLALLKAIRDAKSHLELSEARFDEVATSSASGIAISGADGRFVRTNNAFGTILGYTQPELSGLGLFDVVHPDNEKLLRDDYRDLAEGRIDRVKQNQRLLRKDGDTAWVSLTASLLAGAEGGGDRPPQFVTVVEDGTELLLLQSELSRQALHDVQTGLPNRQYFTTHLESVLRRVDPALGVTLFHLDLDAFTVISDGLGYHVGEQFLRTVAHRLQGVVAGQRAMVTRLGADEFAILLENSATTAAVEVTVAAITEALAEPCYVDGHGLATTVSVGVVHRPDLSASPPDLLRDADLALHQAKRRGRGQWALFHPETDTDVRRGLAVAAAMPGAREVGEIDVRYRPLVRLADSRVVGVEALLSWEHPELGTLSHQRCVELAEETGLILTLGESLLLRACQQVRWWSQQLDRRLSLSVAFSAHQSSDDRLVSRVTRALGDSGLPADRLLAGIPSASLTGGGTEAVANLRALASNGVRAVIRDFGASTGELAAVEDLPVRSVWLTPSLVRRQRHGTSASGDSPVVRALAGLGALVQPAGATLVVDGVETAGQARWWRRAGAESAVGDYFGTAKPADELAAHFGESPWL